MYRRDFLGSVLGTFATSKLPWIATPLPDNDFISGDFIEPNDKVMRLLCSSKQDIKRMVKGAIDITNFNGSYVSDETVIQHESIKDVTFFYDRSNDFNFQFKMEAINVLQSIRTTKTALYYAFDDTIFRPYSKLCSDGIIATNGDVIHVSMITRCDPIPNKFINRIKKVHPILTWKEYVDAEKRSY